jgi:hypothetical protein
MLLSPMMEVHMSSSPAHRPTRLFAFLALAAFALPGATACGSDDGERGLQPGHETASPASDTEDAMTEAERRKREVREIQQAEAEPLDRAEGD